VKYFNYSYLVVSNDAMCTCEINSRIVMIKAASNRNALFASKLDLNIRKALYSAENYTLRKLVQKTLEISEVWCCRTDEIS
jgi:hypothetical protein